MRYNITNSRYKKFYFTCYPVEMKIKIIVIIIVVFLMSSLCSGCLLKSNEGKLKEDSASTIPANDSNSKDLTGQQIGTDEDNLQDDQAADIKDNEPGEKIGQNINLDISYFFDVPGSTSKIEFISVIPSDYQSRQKVSGSSFSIEPFNYFSSGTTRYARFVIQEPDKDFYLDIDIDMRLLDYDLETAREVYIKNGTWALSSKEYASYTAGEKNIEAKDPEIVKIAGRFEAEDQVSLVRQIYDFVLERLDYHGYNPDDCGAVAALSNGGGDCTEYSDLFVALCRAKGIPARVIEGYIADSSPDEIGMGHNWSEVYFEDFGWVPFDCTFDDNNGNSKDTTFENLKSVYIYNSFTRNDPAIFGYHYYAYYYYGDEISVEKSVTVDF
jgi:transglutaminase-like putative cysteine protease